MTISSIRSKELTSDNKQQKKENITQFKKHINNHFLYDFVKVTGILPALLIMRPRIYHCGNKESHKIKGGMIVSANHITFTDVILLLCAIYQRRLYSLATKDLFNTKLKEKFFTLVHCILVDKDNFSLSALHDVIDCLKAGKALLVFPEGNVNVGATEISKFKSGIVLMAHMSNVPILPVYHEVRKKWYLPRPVVIGDPINVRELCGPIPTVEQIESACEVIKEREAQLQSYCKEVTQKKKNINKGGSI